MINYAHRGASEYAPENTMSSFYLGLLQGANGIETDIQRTKDGSLVLFHDASVDRVSNNAGLVSDYTLDELRKIKIYGNATTGFYDHVVTLREFLAVFSNYDIAFALELKNAGVEEETLRFTEEYKIMERTTFTSFQFDYIKKIKAINPRARIGWLTDKTDDETINLLKEIGGEEIVPHAGNITEQLVAKWKGAGLGVRAWGVSNVTLMKKMCNLRIDGMTVNFPDRLYQYLHVPQMENEKQL